MLEFDPSDPQELAFALHKAVRMSGLKLGQITEQQKKDYAADISVCALSNAIHRGTIHLQRALQILAICGAHEIHIKQNR